MVTGFIGGKPIAVIVFPEFLEEPEKVLRESVKF